MSILLHKLRLVVASLLFSIPLTIPQPVQSDKATPTQTVSPATIVAALTLPKQPQFPGDKWAQNYQQTVVQPAEQAQAAEQAKIQSDPIAYAQSLVDSSQWGCLYALWMRESGWNVWATNPSSGAFGIPQELGHPVSQAYLNGDPVAQVDWGLNYIAQSYGTPCGAWNHEVSYGWY